MSAAVLADLGIQDQRQSWKAFPKPLHLAKIEKASQLPIVVKYRRQETESKESDSMIISFHPMYRPSIQPCSITIGSAISLMIAIGMINSKLVYYPFGFSLNSSGLQKT